MRQLIVAYIDKDYINSGTPDNPPDVLTRVGTQWTKDEILDHLLFGAELVEWPDVNTRFRLLDDDREVYYGGWLLNDDECVTQEALLRWGERDAGCVIIEIKNTDGEWVQEIG